MEAHGVTESGRHRRRRREEAMQTGTRPPMTADTRVDVRQHRQEEPQLVQPSQPRPSASSRPSASQASRPSASQASRPSASRPSASRPSASFQPLASRASAFQPSPSRPWVCQPAQSQQHAAASARRAAMRGSGRATNGKALRRLPALTPGDPWMQQASAARRQKWRHTQATRRTTREQQRTEAARPPLDLGAGDAEPRFAGGCCRHRRQSVRVTTRLATSAPRHRVLPRLAPPADTLAPATTTKMRRGRTQAQRGAVRGATRRQGLTAAGAGPPGAAAASGFWRTRRSVSTTGVKKSVASSSAGTVS